MLVFCLYTILKTCGALKCLQLPNQAQRSYGSQPPEGDTCNQERLGGRRWSLCVSGVCSEEEWLKTFKIKKHLEERKDQEFNVSVSCKSKNKKKGKKNLHLPVLRNLWHQLPTIKMKYRQISFFPKFIFKQRLFCRFFFKFYYTRSAERDTKKFLQPN